MGDADCFLVKKEVNLPPGVCGFFWSMPACDLVDDAELVRNGGGRDPGFNAISSSTAKSLGAPLGDAGRAPALVGGLWKSSVETRGSVLFDEDFAMLSGCDPVLVRTGGCEDTAAGLLISLRWTGALLSNEIVSGESGNGCGESVLVRPAKCCIT